jgi:hypothetical protein
LQEITALRSEVAALREQSQPRARADL